MTHKMLILSALKIIAVAVAVAYWLRRSTANVHRLPVTAKTGVRSDALANEVPVF